MYIIIRCAFHSPLRFSFARALSIVSSVIIPCALRSSVRFSFSLALFIISRTFLSCAHFFRQCAFQSFLRISLFLALFIVPCAFRHCSLRFSFVCALFIDFLRISLLSSPIIWQQDSSFALWACEQSSCRGLALARLVRAVNTRTFTHVISSTLVGTLVGHS